MKGRRRSFTTRYMAVVGIIMLVTNSLLGFVILHQSAEALRKQNNSEMLAIVKSAAGLMDGDVLGSLTEDDVDGEAFQSIENQLLVFQASSEIRFIYAVKQIEEDQFVFTVDPDPVDPGAFGEEIVLTEALVQAGKGIAAVDAAPEADRWGNYYSAYAPVFDSNGKVAGIIGIDFDAEIYETVIRQHITSISILTLASLIISCVVLLGMTVNVKKRFNALDSELSELVADVDQLVGDENTEEHQTDLETADEIEKLTRKIHAMGKGVSFFERLQKDQYYHDTLTGLPNLNFIKQFSDEKLRQMREEALEPALLLFDVRSFVAYNAEYGYSRGDELLKITAQTITDHFPGAFVGRGEGDHFVVYAPYSDDLGAKAEAIHETVKAKAYGKITGIQCVIVKMENGMEVHDGINHARNTLKKISDDLNIVYQQCNPDEDHEFQISQHVVRCFEEAMDKGWIRVYYQPIMQTRTGKIAAMEALARWIDPEYGFISPGQFIPVLSQYHLLYKLDMYMAEQVCKEHEKREAAGFGAVSVSVNFSAQDFDYIDVVGNLEHLIKKYDLTRDRIIVEITEQDLAQATEHFKTQVSRIHEIGYRLWIDDFGSGYSSLNVFSQYHVDRIKLDMELLRHLDENNGVNRIMIKAIVDMCRQMGIHTLAEGVEVEEQHKFLSDVECELEQGFYFAKPEPVSAVLEKMK